MSALPNAVPRRCRQVAPCTSAMALSSYIIYIRRPLPPGPTVGNHPRRHRNLDVGGRCARDGAECPGWRHGPDRSTCRKVSTTAELIAEVIAGSKRVSVSFNKIGDVRQDDGWRMEPRHSFAPRPGCAPARSRLLLCNMNCSHASRTGRSKARKRNPPAKRALGRQTCPTASPASAKSAGSSAGIARNGNTGRGAIFRVRAKLNPVPRARQPFGPLRSPDASGRCSSPHSDGGDAREQKPTQSKPPRRQVRTGVLQHGRPGDPAARAGDSRVRAARIPVPRPSGIGSTRRARCPGGQTADVPRGLCRRGALPRGRGRCASARSLAPTQNPPARRASA